MVGGGKQFMRFDFDDKEVRNVQVAVQRYVNDVFKGSEDAVQEAAHKVLGTAMALVPVKTGKLAASGRVDMSQRGGVALPSGKGKKIEAVVTFGGSDPPYAPFVELGITPFGEMVTFTKAGTQAHFLRDALEMNREEFSNTLSTKLRRIRIRNR